MIRFWIVILAVTCYAGLAAGQWSELAAGFEVGEFAASKQSIVGDSKISIVRLDPNLWELAVQGVDWTKGSKIQTAKDWCALGGLTIAINAGMFASDYSTHVGFLMAGDVENNSHITNYMSVVAFGSGDGSGVPTFGIYDLDRPNISIDDLVAKYDNVIQNLRLIKKAGENRWSKQSKMWSEAALGEDDSGRILFIFCRSPYSMYDLNEELIGLGIGIVAAQHLEGGPEAQMYFSIDGVEQELFGSYETDFIEDDSNNRAWPVPIVLGARPRAGGR